MAEWKLRITAEVTIHQFIIIGFLRSLRRKNALCLLSGKLHKVAARLFFQNGGRLRFPAADFTNGDMWNNPLAGHLPIDLTHHKIQ